MTRTKALAATAAVLSITLIAAGATFRNTRPSTPRPAPRPSIETDFDDRWTLSKKADRLPAVVPTPLAAVTSQSEVTAPVASSLPQATEDDIRQAEAEHHRHRDLCPHGRNYFTIDHHRYWRCKL